MVRYISVPDAVQVVPTGVGVLSFTDRAMFYTDKDGHTEPGVEFEVRGRMVYDRRTDMVHGSECRTFIFPERLTYITGPLWVTRHFTLWPCEGGLRMIRSGVETQLLGLGVAYIEGGSPNVFNTATDQMAGVLLPSGEIADTDAVRATLETWQGRLAQGFRVQWPLAPVAVLDTVMIAFNTRCLKSIVRVGDSVLLVRHNGAEVRRTQDVTQDVEGCQALGLFADGTLWFKRGTLVGVLDTPPSCDSPAPVDSPTLRGRPEARSPSLFVGDVGHHAEPARPRGAGDAPQPDHVVRVDPQAVRVGFK